MIAILSDIHGNLPALEAVLKHAKMQGCQKFISLGDVVGYYAQPGECIDILNKLNCIHILGNHDQYLIGDGICKRSKLVTDTLTYHKKIVTSEQIQWLSSSLLSYQKDDALFVHGGPKDMQDQYLYSVNSETIPKEFNFLFSGHTHVQASISIDSKTYCNPGSVGQPRDGDARAAYALFEDSVIELHRVEYDIDETAFHMKLAGFLPHYYENLYRGSQIGGRIDSIKLLTT